MDIGTSFAANLAELLTNTIVVQLDAQIKTLVKKIVVNSKQKKIF
jgi:hypothetical protein